VSASNSNFYAQWRAQSQARWRLAENAGDAPPESLLQSIWLHQRLRRDELQTADGQAVRVLHPGFWNREAGPDFHGAVLQFGSQPPLAGDVEIDLTPGHWQAHRHEGNPNFAGVILRVVWHGAKSGEQPTPMLALEKFLDRPLAELEEWAATPDSGEWPETLQGACAAPLAELAPERASELLRQAALVRFERKAGEIEARARQVGWEQSLWENLFRALGYKQNTWPFLRIAELLPRLRSLPATKLGWQARLLGVAGLLPADISRGGGEEFSRGLWDHWWRERENFAEVILPRSLWRFHGLRPANQPQRRLALAAHWLAAKDLPGRLEDWFVNEKDAEAAPQSLLACLQAPSDEFWSWHWGLRTAKLARPQALLGAERVTDLAVNVILPWFWTRARAGGNEVMRKLAEERYFAWPAAQDNAVLRLARRRLLGRGGVAGTVSASAQQGLLQIVRDFCDHSNAICADCSFPGLVRGFAITG
jgi:Protein of unknown function (DUF2851)